MSALRKTFGPYKPNPLLDDALDALDREGDGNPDAARLVELILKAPPGHWYMLEVLCHSDGCVKSRPRLVSVLLKQLSDAFPVSQ